MLSCIANLCRPTNGHTGRRSDSCTDRQIDRRQELRRPARLTPQPSPNFQTARPQLEIAATHCKQGRPCLLIWVFPATFPSKRLSPPSKTAAPTSASREILIDTPRNKKTPQNP